MNPSPLERMRALVGREYDHEQEHIEADDILLEVLRLHGETALCDEYAKLTRWFG